MSRGAASHGAELELAAAYRSALRRFLRRTEVVVEEVGLTPERYDLLLAITAAAAGRRAATIGALSLQLELRQQAVTELVKRAEEAGLVERRRSPDDGRVVLLAPTAEGKRRMMKAFRTLGRDREMLVDAFHELDTHFRESVAAERRPSRGR